MYYETGYGDKIIVYIVDKKYAWSVGGVKKVHKIIILNKKSKRGYQRY